VVWPPLMAKWLGGGGGGGGWVQPLPFATPKWFESGLGHSYLAICGVRITLNGGWAKLSGLVVCEI
jgi:hypothetical protein